MKMSEVFTGGKVVEIGGYHDNDAYINTEEHGFGTDEDGVSDAVIHAINMHDELVDALEQTAIELHNCIQAINQYKAKEVTSLDLDPPDYHDFQTVHESMLLVKKAKS